MTDAMHTLRRARLANKEFPSEPSHTLACALQSGVANWVIRPSTGVFPVLWPNVITAHEKWVPVSTQWGRHVLLLRQHMAISLPASLSADSIEMEVCT